MRQRDSPENAKEFIVTSPHVTPHPIVSRLESRTLNSQREPEKKPSRPQDVREPIKHREMPRNVM